MFKYFRIKHLIKVLLNLYFSFQTHVCTIFSHYVKTSGIILEFVAFYYLNINEIIGCNKQFSIFKFFFMFYWFYTYICKKSCKKQAKRKKNQIFLKLNHTVLITDLNIDDLKH